MKTNTIRKLFLDYFVEQGHQLVKSSSLVPENDQTLLFTNAGMVPFKQHFLGHKNNLTKATSAQCCVRAGGKHNDLENVGYTARHHTFFEMLGNFSFGDYFKQEAIHLAWDFITKILLIPKEKLWISVYEKDAESAKIWLEEIGVDPARFSYCGADDNFWSMGATGPCGPCTEIFFDHGPEIYGGPPGSKNADGDRYMEIWNLVFMESEKLESGDLVSLPMRSVDTGMGLERIASVLQGVHTNYETDTFISIINDIKANVSATVDDSIAYKVIADHLRAIVFIMAEGITPSNDGRGYVLRRIIRRAARYGNKLGIQTAFLYKLVTIVNKHMGLAYPHLTAKLGDIAKYLHLEEEKFITTLKQGLQILDKKLVNLSNDVIHGELIFRMYDTYGFPVDLLQDIAKEHDLGLDLSGFEVLMQQQKNLAKASSTFSHAKIAWQEIKNTNFVGYTSYATKACISKIIQDDQFIQTLANKDMAALVLDVTTFYPEGGGQLGDTGIITGSDFSFKVEDTQIVNDKILHYGRLINGTISEFDQVMASIDISRRQDLAKNHTATHLLHAALRSILGNHITQKGSVVKADKLRFDFAYNDPLSAKQLQQIEQQVNEQISSNIKVITKVMDSSSAIAEGAIAIFTEKYADKSRVVDVAGYSKELCGGTHVNALREISIFLITGQSAVANGVRRIEAITGNTAWEQIYQNRDTVVALSKLAGVARDKLTDKVKNLLKQNKAYQKVKGQNDAKNSINQVLDKARSEKIVHKEFSVSAITLDGINMNELKQVADSLTQADVRAVVLLISVQADSMSVVCKLGSKAMGIIEPAAVVKLICGQGGGRADMAQGGGKTPLDIKAKLAAAKDYILSKIGN